MLRARKTEDKEERRRSILRTAHEVWRASNNHAAFNMSDVAEGAGLAKGTLYLYFPTKEALLLALLQEALGSWLDVVDDRLDAGGAWTPRRVAHMLAEELAARPMLTHLLSLMSAILEQNTPAGSVLGFKEFLRGRVLVTGARIEKRLPLLGSGQGAKLLLYCHALVTGLDQMARPAPAVQEVLKRPEMAVFRVDFTRDLQEALLALLVGFADTKTLA